jgi:predicted metal-dependent hydrolase
LFTKKSLFKKELTTSTILVNDLEIFLSRKRIKNIYLRISSEGQVSVSAPKLISTEKITAFIEAKLDWIIKHRRKILSKPIQAPPKFSNNELHWFLGKSYPLIIYNNAKKSCVLLDNNQISCFLKENSSEDLKQKLLKQWYVTQIKLILPELIKKWEPVLGVEVYQWGVRAMKTRWGSCNIVKHRIWINTNLIYKPSICLEYVLVHEMVHLLEPSHNKRFHALMSHFMPDWKEIKKKLTNC